MFFFGDRVALVGAVVGDLSGEARGDTEVSSSLSPHENETPIDSRLDALD